ncbi:uncharacterized protein EV422DRAFT_234128 [Fimicolochytrium jonesii]|uniref:uncharacterized protein n=1 Tax=Fimicolochytrium jonesii TaxID=1396493 RepID=UPI0022FDB0BF|nr:uncharacterized protein EV422DRAFT_234128 [Fimicolochytrium jonesii]KAI8824807.1 hypothetical protein EV422DRAFT_234128 [Fimicolochytrium jonesii]
MSVGGHRLAVDLTVQRPWEKRGGLTSPKCATCRVAKQQIGAIALAHSTTFPIAAVVTNGASTEINFSRHFWHVPPEAIRVQLVKRLKKRGDLKLLPKASFGACRPRMLPVDFEQLKIRLRLIRSWNEGETRSRIGLVCGRVSLRSLLHRCINLWGRFPYFHRLAFSNGRHRTSCGLLHVHLLDLRGVSSFLLLLKGH